MANGDMVSQWTKARQALSERLRINKEALDEEMVQHPDLLYRVGSGHAKAESDRDGQKDALKQIEAVAGARYRAEMEAAGQKTTEKAVEQAIHGTEEYAKAKSLYLDLCHEADLWFALREAFQARGYMIHSLAGMLTSQHKADGGRSYSPPPQSYSSEGPYRSGTKREEPKDDEAKETPKVRRERQTL